MTIVHTSMQQGYRGQSTTAQAQAGNNTTADMSPARVKEAIAALGSMGIGDGQTWQNMTGVYINNITYTNTTGRTKVVYANIVSPSLQPISLGGYVDGMIISYITEYASGGGYYAQQTLIVPNGSTFMFNGSLALHTVSELS